MTENALNPIDELTPGNPAYKHIDAVYHWPLYAVGEDGGSVYIDCDYCGFELWPMKGDITTSLMLDELYRLVSDHIANCAKAP